MIKTDSPDVLADAVAHGRSLVRAVEALEAVTEHTGGFGWIESAARCSCLTAYRHNLRRLVAELPGELTAEKLAASEGALGKLPTRDPSLN